MSYEEKVRLGVEMFAASRTAKNHRHGPTVVRTLGEYEDQGKIGTGPIYGKGKQNIAAEYQEAWLWIKDKILLTSGALAGEEPYISILIVHEAVHAFRGTDLDSELEAYDLQLDYLQELEDTGVELGGVTHTVLGGRYPRYDRMLQARQSNRVVDMVLQDPAYSSKLTAQWVAGNLANWGGLDNRLADTRSLYVMALAKGGPIYADPVMKILHQDSLDSHLFQQHIQTGGDPLRQLIQAMKYSPQRYRELQTLQNQTRVNLGM